MSHQECHDDKVLWKTNLRNNFRKKEKGVIDRENETNSGGMPVISVNFWFFNFHLFFCSKWWNSMGNFLINKLDISTDPEIRTEHSLRNARNVISSRILKVLLRLRRCSALFSKRQRLPRTLRNYSKETRKKYDIRQFKTSSEKDIVLFHDNYLLWLLPGSWTLLILTWIIFQSIFIIYTLPPV